MHFKKGLSMHDFIVMNKHFNIKCILNVAPICYNLIITFLDDFIYSYFYRSQCIFKFKTRLIRNLYFDSILLKDTVLFLTWVIHITLLYTITAFLIYTNEISDMNVVKTIILKIKLKFQIYKKLYDKYSMVVRCRFWDI